MEVFLIKALQLILCFAILVLLHEGGHFFFAKLFKVRVEKFCLFFDPWLTPFKFKPKKSDTTYAIGWLPLGGYVKIAGMIDESMDKEQMKGPVQPWEFRAKPAWQRLLIMLGGVLVNFFLALFIYAMLLFVNGDSYVSLQDMKQGMAFSEVAQQYGFKNGDILLTADGDTLKRFDSNNAVGSVYRKLSTAKEVKVLRQGEEVTISLPGDLNMLDMFKASPPFVSVLMPAILDSVPHDSKARQAGLDTHDRIISVNGQAISTWNEYNVILKHIHDKLAENPKDSVKYRQIVMEVQKAAGGQTDTLSVSLDTDLRLDGLKAQSPMKQYANTEKTYGFLEAFPAGAAHGWQVMAGYVNDLKYLFTADGAKSMGSFLTIGNLFPSSWDWTRFWEMTAFISIILAFMNILPIPALDGGHVLFLLYEIITRRTPSDKFMEYAQTAGMGILILLMLWAIFNDAIRFIF